MLKQARNIFKRFLVETFTSYLEEEPNFAQDNRTLMVDLALSLNKTHVAKSTELLNLLHASNNQTKVQECIKIDWINVYVYDLYLMFRYSKPAATPGSLCNRFSLIFIGRILWMALETILSCLFLLMILNWTVAVSIL